MGGGARTLTQVFWLMLVLFPLHCLITQIGSPCPPDAGAGLGAAFGNKLHAVPALHVPMPHLILQGVTLFSKQASRFFALELCFW